MGEIPMVSTDPQDQPAADPKAGESEARTTGDEAPNADLNKYVILILVGSFFEMWSAGTACNFIDDCSDEYAWAVAAGVLSLAICTVMAGLIICKKSQTLMAG